MSKEKRGSGRSYACFLNAPYPPSARTSPGTERLLFLGSLALFAGVEAGGAGERFSGTATGWALGGALSCCDSSAKSFRQNRGSEASLLFATQGPSSWSRLVCLGRTGRAGSLKTERPDTCLPAGNVFSRHWCFICWLHPLIFSCPLCFSISRPRKLYLHLVPNLQSCLRPPVWFTFESKGQAVRLQEEHPPKSTSTSLLARKAQFVGLVNYFNSVN